jgi:diadenylate cyclase
LMGPLESLYTQLVFFISNLTWLSVVDLILVTGAFYLMLTLLRQSSAGFLLREVVGLVVGLFIITTILPLPVFDWLLRGFLLALLVATPIVFQAQIRQFLGRVSRSTGISAAARRDLAETLVPEIVHAAENMASSRTGALIAIEGNDPLDEVAQSGIGSGGRITSELLQSIFFVGTPLHDGAVIVRGNQIMAAGCVLPLSQQDLLAEKRLGTRHRAAVGLSEVSDGLVIVVSEETGQIGVAQSGQLERPVSAAQLRDILQDFFEPTNAKQTAPSLWTAVRQMVQYLWQSSIPDGPRSFISNIGLLLMAAALTFVLWTFVLEQTNALELVRVEGIPLRVEGQPANTSLIPMPPKTVSVIVQTPTDVLPTLSASSFQAVMIIEDNKPGVYRLPVEIESGVGQVLIVAAEPQTIDFQMVPVISATFPVEVQIPDLEQLSAAYEVVGAATTRPETVQVLGPAPQVEKVTAIRMLVSVANSNTSIRENRPVTAIDQAGQVVDGVALLPDQVRVNLVVRQRLNASDVSVQATVTGSPPMGYQLRSVGVEPTSVTLQGSVEQLSQLGSVVNTLPVEIDKITGNATVQTALDLPPNVQAMDPDGNPARAVTVTVRVAPLNGNLNLQRPVRLINVNPAITTTVIPETVDLLLSGPIPTLDEIKADPGLVQVLVDAATVGRRQTTNLTPEVTAPSEVNVQVVPPSVQVQTE